MLGFATGFSAMQGLGNMALQSIENNLARQRADELQQTVFAREDSQIQRRLQDAKLAGVNPLVALGAGGMGAATIVTPAQFTPPQLTGVPEALIAEQNTGVAAEGNQIKWAELGLEQEKMQEQTRQFNESVMNAKTEAELNRAHELRIKQLDHAVMMKIEEMHDERERELAQKQWEIEKEKIRTQVSENAKNRTHDTLERKKDRVVQYTQIAEKAAADVLNFIKPKWF